MGSKLVTLKIVYTPIDQAGAPLGLGHSKSEERATKKNYLVPVLEPKASSRRCCYPASTGGFVGKGPTCSRSLSDTTPLHLPAGGFNSTRIYKSHRITPRASTP